MEVWDGRDVAVAERISTDDRACLHAARLRLTDLQSIRNPRTQALFAPVELS